jgi:hypothetical protein
MKVHADTHSCGSHSSRRFCYLPSALHTEIRTAEALTREAVWNAISAAKDGDTVQLPQGTAVWKRGWNTNHWAKMKAIMGIRTPFKTAGMH